MVKRHREFASAILIDTQGRLLLQQRDDISGIRYPGKIGLFGGHREDHETFLECVVREVQEEIGTFVSPERFHHLTSYSNVDLDGGTVRGEMFFARGVPRDSLTITEGSLLVVDVAELPSLTERMAPSTLAAVRAFCASGLSLL